MKGEGERKEKGKKAKESGDGAKAKGDSPKTEKDKKEVNGQEKGADSPKKGKRKQLSKEESEADSPKKEKGRKQIDREETKPLENVKKVDDVRGPIIHSSTCRRKRFSLLNLLDLGVLLEKVLLLWNMASNKVKTNQKAKRDRS